MTNNQTIGLIAGVVLLVAVTAAASTYITKANLTPETSEKPEISHPITHSSANAHTSANNNVHWNQTQTTSAPQHVVAAAPCNDQNIVGKAVGGIGGGLVGSRFGKGGGKTATTIGGTLGGAYLGGQYIPTQNVTCR